VITIAKQTQQYDVEDWVRPVESTRRTISADDNSNDDKESNDDDEMEGQEYIQGQDDEMGMEDGG
jgi:hypothetical protein